MKKIAILTIVSPNYGNRLQNYALYTILKKLGFDVYNVRSEPNSLRKFIRPLIIKDKYTSFANFNKNFKWTKSYVNSMNYSKEIADEIDAFVVGSDQIWNITFDFISETSFLPFIKDKRKISYSASFGVDKLNDKLKDAIKYLSDYYAISVREDAGADYIEEVLGIRPEVHLDPTMLLDVSEWRKLEKAPKSREYQKKYIFVYFLGNITEERKTFIEDISKKYNLKICNVLDEKSVVNDAGPSEFLYLISHSDLIITDSFHASVFSILYSKPFLVFGRDSKDENMNSRIVTLLTIFNLKRKYVQSVDAVTDDEIFNNSYNCVTKVLETERIKSMKYLEESLKDL